MSKSQYLKLFEAGNGTSFSLSEKRKKLTSLCLQKLSMAFGGEDFYKKTVIF